ncbi:DUF3768 domain-containing protein [Methylocystis sp. H4A]|nr:DUF3768 domain-containing protein [Methylocystis sp. H4A]
MRLLRHSSATPEDVDLLISPRRFLRRSTIAELNDAFRRQGASGVTCFTNGLAAPPTTAQEAQEQIVRRVGEFDAFTEGSDPYGEHDRNRRYIQRPWRSHRGTRERSQSRDCHPAQRRDHDRLLDRHHHARRAHPSLHRHFAYHRPHRRHHALHHHLSCQAIACASGRTPESLHLTARQR